MAIDLSIKWLKVREVATWLNVSVQHVGDHIREGRLPAVRMGKEYRIAQKDLEKFLERNRTVNRQGQPAR